VLWAGAPDCPVCHRTVSGAPCPYEDKPATLGFQPAHFAVIHRTVRCTSGATAIQCNGRLQQRTDSATMENSVQQSQCAESEAHRTVNRTCPVPHEDKVSNGLLLPNPNGWVTWRRTGQSTGPVRWRTGLSDAPIDSSLPQRPFCG
jgi:hypothetical protein